MYFKFRYGATERPGIDPHRELMAPVNLNHRAIAIAGKKDAGGEIRIGPNLWLTDVRNARSTTIMRAHEYFIRDLSVSQPRMSVKLLDRDDFSIFVDASTCVSQFLFVFGRVISVCMPLRNALTHELRHDSIHRSLLVYRC